MYCFRIENVVDQVHGPWATGWSDPPSTKDMEIVASLSELGRSGGVACWSPSAIAGEGDTGNPFWASPELERW
jgi:hypothetical protein